MVRVMRSTILCLMLVSLFLLAGIGHSRASHIATRSAILIDAADGQVLYEQDADALIPPASVTKILTLYLIFDAIKKGDVHPWDEVKVSRKAANTGGSRMGLRAGREVHLEELIKGIAVVSGNDAAVAAAEHLAGSVENFVDKMNVKARELGMTHSEFKTPNGLPAKGQVTTARDLAKLSSSYIQHYPEALHIHSMTSYTYGSSSHHNANRLLGVCPGVDGIKTGFVCASGFNLAATAKRGDVRLIAVVMGARAPWVRTMETQKLLEAGFQKVNAVSGDNSSVGEILAKWDASGSGRNVRMTCPLPSPAAIGHTANSKHSKVLKSASKVQGSQKVRTGVPERHSRAERKAMVGEDSCPVAKPLKSAKAGGKQPIVLAKQTLPFKKNVPLEKSDAVERNSVKKPNLTAKEAKALKPAAMIKKQCDSEKTCPVQFTSKPANSAKQKLANDAPKKSDKKL
jgi:D-alanyl-D-alanine carboxypeptidase